MASIKNGWLFYFMNSQAFSVAYFTAKISFPSTLIPFIPIACALGKIPSPWVYSLTEVDIAY